MAHRSRIDLAAREIIGGKVMVNNAARNIVKGRTLVDNTYRDIFFGIPIGTLDVGETVLMDIDGRETEFLIVNQGNPDGSIYDASCDGTWLLAKNILEKKEIQPLSNQYYSGSSIHEYLNGEFLARLDSRTQDAIADVKVPYHIDTETVSSGKDGLPTKIFPLSYSELNLYARPAIGAALPYFSDAVIPSLYDRLMATLNGIAGNWMVRDFGRASAHYCGIGANGAPANFENGDTVGIRPAMIMPFETRVTNTRHEIIG